MIQNGNGHTGARDFALELARQAATKPQMETERAPADPAPSSLLCAMGLHRWSKWRVEREATALGGLRVVLVRGCTRCQRPDSEVYE